MSEKLIGSDNNVHIEENGASRTAVSASRSGERAADRLRRALIGKTRSQIIAASGVSDGTISRVLRGETTRRGTLSSLAEALGVSSAWLIDGEGEMLGAVVTRAPHHGSADDFAREVIVQAGVLMQDALLPKVDLPRLTVALQIVEQAARQHHPNQTIEQKAEALIVAYDMIAAYGPDYVKLLLDLKSAIPDAKLPENK